MKRSKRGARVTALWILVAAGLAGLALAPVQTGCATQTVAVSTRALERSGRASFVCLDKPGPGATALRPITDCNASTVIDINDYTTTPDAGVVPKPQPHLYALVTQTTRGEVAVIDTTSVNNYVLDQDPSVPGANFLPIGAQPVDIVSSPGGTATFVGVAEIGREGLFALPSTMIRPATADGSGGAGGGSTTGGTTSLPEISQWPSCRLPAAPGQMLLIPDPEGKASPTDKPATRPCCDAAYGDAADAKVCQPAAAAGESPRGPGQNGDIEAEGQGRQKLVVAIPSMGGVAVIDAQALLDTAPGVYAPCNVERWLELSTDVPPLPPKSPTGGKACVDPKIETPALPTASVSRPTTLAYAGGRLYASDLETSLIHVIDLPTPCEPVETRPLLPTSLEDPKRPVTTTHVAVAPSLTPDLKRYLYAVDALDGSAMVFDVSDDQSSQFPLQRPHPEWDPSGPTDRIRFSAPAADLVIVQRDYPETDPATGTAPEGIRCDPDPSLSCIPTSQTCDIAAFYRTDITTYATGAGPYKLRGTFAFLALTSGRVAVIDIDDYDAACRGPVAKSPLFGCGDAATPPGVTLATANELSCNVVLPNAPRMSTYFAANQAAGLNQAGIQGYPQLFDVNGAPVDDLDPAAPRLIATLPAAGALASGSKLQLSVGGALIDINTATGSIVDPTFVQKSSLLMNLEDPRAQLADQNWFVTFEGPLPGFDQKLAKLDLAGTGLAGTDQDALEDVSSRFCDAGVQSKNAVLASLDPADEKVAADLADYVQIQTELPDEADLYWETKKTEKPVVCDFNDCRILFGSVDVPTTGRDFRITEAYQDHVTIEPRADFPATPNTKPEDWRATTKCCFPSLVSFNVRVGHQWEVAGDKSGFLHHVIADPATGVCRDSCDPTQARKNGRALRVAYPDLEPDPANRKSQPVVVDQAPLAFINPMFRFAVLDPPAITVKDPKTLVESKQLRAPVLGQQFRFSTQGAFKPLLIDLSPDGTTLIQPAGISFIPPTGQLAVTDGSTNGLLLIDLSSSKVSRSFF